MGIIHQLFSQNKHMFDRALNTLLVRLHKVKTKMGQKFVKFPRFPMTPGTGGIIKQVIS